MNGLYLYRRCMALSMVAEMHGVEDGTPEADECHAAFTAMPKFWRAMALTCWGFPLDALYELAPRIGRPLILFRNWKAGA